MYFILYIKNREGKQGQSPKWKKQNEYYEKK